MNVLETRIAYGLFRQGIKTLLVTKHGGQWYEVITIVSAGATRYKLVLRRGSEDTTINVSGDFLIYPVTGAEYDSLMG